ncbi:MAG: transposase [Ardenticatenaceae bacterium]|nr:transposase [Ardenticatenaceae bacterium]
MKESPIFVIYLIETYLQEVLAWCSQWWYEQLLTKWQDEELYQWQHQLDFSPLEQACAAYHQGRVGQRGRPIEHSVSKLVRVLFLMYSQHCSYRQAESNLRRDMLWRWFAGYGLFAPVPDHNSIYLFDQYVRQHHPRLYLDTVLRQIDAQMPSVRQEKQCGDTFAVHANAALEGPSQRLRHLVSRLLAAVDKAAPAAYEAVIAQFEEGELFGWQEQTNPYRLSAEERQARRQQTVLATLACREAVRPLETLIPLAAQWAAYIDKVISDEFQLQADETGRIIGATLLPEKERGTHRICSATDPEASIRNHGPDKQDFGFNVSLAITSSGLIREIQADTGSQADVVAIPDLLRCQQAAHDLLPEKLLYDQIAGNGKTAALVAEVSGGQTQLVAKPMPYEERSQKFGPQDCQLSEDGLCLTCPHGRTSRNRYAHPSGGHTFRFGKGQCVGCPLLQDCRGRKKQPTTPRNFYIGPYYAHYQTLVAYALTAEFREDMKQRPRVELTIAHLVGHHGVRRARVRGISKVDYRLKMTATIYNVRWWHRRQARLARENAQQTALPRPHCAC